MENILSISTRGDPDLKTELFDALHTSGVEVRKQGDRIRGPVSPIDLVVTLSSAGTLTVLYQVFAKIFEKNKDREITVEFKGKKFTLKGHSLQEEKEFVEKFLPLLTGSKPKRRRSKK